MVFGSYRRDEIGARIAFFSRKYRRWTTRIGEFLISEKCNLIRGETCEKRVELKRRNARLIIDAYDHGDRRDDQEVRDRVHVSAMLITSSASHSKINSAV